MKKYNSDRVQSCKQQEHPAAASYFKFTTVIYGPWDFSYITVATVEWYILIKSVEHWLTLKHNTWQLLVVVWMLLYIFAQAPLLESCCTACRWLHCFTTWLHSFGVHIIYSSDSQPRAIIPQRVLLQESGHIWREYEVAKKYNYSKKSVPEPKTESVCEKQS